SRNSGCCCPLGLILSLYRSWEGFSSARHLISERWRDRIELSPPTIVTELSRKPMSTPCLLATSSGVLSLTCDKKYTQKMLHEVRKKRVKGKKPSAAAQHLVCL